MPLVSDELGPDTIMVTFHNITIIGSSHIARESVDAVAKAIEDKRPDIIALELDQDRAVSLMQGNEETLSYAQGRSLGWKGYLFARVGHWAEKSLGRMVGVKPGSEMKKAIVLAKKLDIPVVFIDQPIQITLQRFSKKLTWREKGRFVWDIIEGFFRALIRRPEIEFDLRKVPSKELMRVLMSKVRKRYPSIYEVLVTERNAYMAKKLFGLYAKYPEKRILAVMGAGHEDEVLELLRYKDQHSDVIHYTSSFVL